MFALTTISKATVATILYFIKLQRSLTTGLQNKHELMKQAFGIAILLNSIHGNSIKNIQGTFYVPYSI